MPYKVYEPHMGYKKTLTALRCVNQLPGINSRQVRFRQHVEGFAIRKHRFNIKGRVKKIMEALGESVEALRAAWVIHCSTVTYLIYSAHGASAAMFLCCPGLIFLYKSTSQIAAAPLWHCDIQVHEEGLCVFRTHRTLAHL